MAQEIIREKITCKVTGTFARSDSEGEQIGLYLADSDVDGSPTPTVGKVTATNKIIYGKLLNVVKGGDVSSISSVDATTGDVTYGDIVTVATDGILAFTKRDSSDAVTAGAAGDIGEGIEGVGTAGGHVTVATTGIGKVVAYDGNTIYVDMRG